MSETTASGAGGSIAPGWYTDPSDPTQQRWWSGEGWTEHVSGGAPAQPVAAPVAPEPVSADPASADPASADPVSADPVSADPASADPVSADPASAVPASAVPASDQQPAAPGQVAAQPAAPEAYAAPLAAQQPAAAEPVALEPVAPEPVAPEPIAAEPIAAEPVAVSAYQSSAAPLPSRRALRDSVVEPTGASTPVPQFQEPVAPAYAAPAAPAAQPVVVATQALAGQPAPFAPPVQAGSAPVPTLPVQSTSFLEQAGYTPLEPSPSAPVAPSAYPPPGSPVAAAQAAPAPAPAAVDTGAAVALPAPGPQAPVAPAAFVSPAQQPAQVPHAPQPPQPLDASSFEQAAQAAGPFSNQGQWGAPVAVLPPVQPQTWEAPEGAVPGTAPVALAPDGTTALLASAPAPEAGWALTPTAEEVEPGSRRRVAAAGPSEQSVAGSSTLWAWLIAISPILAAGAIGYVIASTGYVTSGWPFEASIAAPYLLVLLFALADRAALITLGHTQPRSPGWALLSAPVYLIMRAAETRSEDGSGTVLTLAWLVSFVLGVAGFVGYGVLTHHALIMGLPV